MSHPEDIVAVRADTPASIESTRGLAVRGFPLLLIGWLAVILGGLMAHLVQTAGGVQVQDLRFSGSGGTMMSALLYRPSTATAKTPAPAILAVHGYINSRETQSAFAIEYARRGYVVLALDQTGHGYSGGAAFANGFGGPDGLKYLRSLDFVDAANIGLEGHSMGGGATLAAARAWPEGYTSMVLEGSATATVFSPPGSPVFPRNLAVVFSKYDEFSQLMWGVPRAADVASSPKLMALAGTTQPLVPGEVLGSTADGTARVLYTPTTTHPGDHLSSEAVGDSLDWFARTLKGGTPKARDDQIWQWKEVGTLVALLGCVLVMVGSFDWLLRLPLFAPLRQPALHARESRDGAWWLAFAITAIVPALTYYPFMYLGQRVLRASSVLPQGITNQIVVWLVLNGLITLILMAVFKVPRRSPARWLPAVLLAFATVASGYVALLLADFLFKVDFRFWVVALKLLGVERLSTFLIYLIPITLCFIVSLRALYGFLPVRNDSATRQYLTAMAALASGFAILLLVQYVPLFVTGHLLLPSQALNAIISIQLVPLMVILATLSMFTWRRTNSYLPGAVICGISVTWYIVAGTATHV